MGIPRWFRDLSLRRKLIVMVLPLALVPPVLVGAVVGTVASQEAFSGVTRASRDDLDHLASFTLDLLQAHHDQFQVYQEDKRRTIREDLASLVNFAVGVVEAQHRAYLEGRITRDEARRLAAEAIRKSSVGRSGYAYAMTSSGLLVAHLAREGEVILDERDPDGRPFIRQMCEEAVAAPPGAVLHTVYPWQNPLFGDTAPRTKSVAFRYFAPWDWIVAAGSYLDETYEDVEFERRSFEALKAKVAAKRVGQTGYIYAIDATGTAVVHPFREGENLADETDDAGRPFIREMLAQKSGWIRYPWQNVTDAAGRMKLVRYVHFEPWDWVVAVGSYENEFFAQAASIRSRVARTTVLLTTATGLAAMLLLVFASRAFTNPIERMTGVIRRVRGGALNERMEVARSDELGELGAAYDHMIEIVREHRAMEQELAQQGKMASLGVLSSTVAHEINNPLGIMLGYAAFLEKKLSPDDPNHAYVVSIRRECQRSKKIVQDLLGYARVSRPVFAPVDVNDLLARIAEFARNHVEMAAVEMVTRFDPQVPRVEADGDQLRQIALNLMLNAGAAMERGGTLTIETHAESGGRVRMVFQDTGAGMSEEVREKMFDAFFTTRARGSGLGLAITRQIVERHRGTIEVETEVGRGTRVTVTLPVVHEEF
ncbi:MAG TPA: cache domain-containing protein [Deferrisomatales bacterium]|nr:cache domain-containing protein [Deferrisomatales bacterium]